MILKSIKQYKNKKEQAKLNRLKAEIEMITGRPIKQISMEEAVEYAKIFAKAVKESGISLKDRS